LAVLLAGHASVLRATPPAQGTRDSVNMLIPRIAHKRTGGHIGSFYTSRNRKIYSFGKYKSIFLS